MSIIATVYIPEGIAMAADSRLTGITTHQENGFVDRHVLSDASQKIFLVNNDTVGISCCGDGQIANKSVGDFIRIFEIEKLGEDETVTSIAEKLKDYTMANHGTGVIYHVCGFDKDEKFVYRILNNEITLMNWNNNTEDYGVTWDGEPEVLANLFCGQNQFPIEFGFMQLKDGSDLAEFMVKVTCDSLKFRSGLATCGGPIDVLILTKDYSKWVRHKILNP